MTNINLLFLYLLGALLLTACEAQSQKIAIPELDLAFDADTIHMSQEAERYIETAVDLMRENALYKSLRTVTDQIINPTPRETLAER